MSNDNAPQADTAPKNGEAPNGKRNRTLLIAAVIFLVIGGVWLTHWALVGRFHEDTDDAYVAGNVLQVTPQTVGTVVAIDADDTDFVKAGQRLVQLDDTDAKVQLAQAEAELAQAVRQVRSLFTSNDALRAKIALQESVLAKAEADLKRRNGLTASGAVSFEELHHSENAVKAAEADVLAAKEELSGNLALTENTSIADHPNVQNAAAKVRAAWLTLQRTKIVAAADGHVAKRSVQLGQRIAPGTPLMAVVPLKQVWIDANFKESQLAKMRIGQPVELTADIYGDKVEYSGRIAGIAAGTGGAFSLLPAQNATGNWIKVVQRLPVRVEIDPEQLQKHPLRIGLSMLVDVNISQQDGLQLSSEGRKQPAWQTAVYVNDSREADARVQDIINANAGAAQKLALRSAGETKSTAKSPSTSGHAHTKTRTQLARNSR